MPRSGYWDGILAREEMRFRDRGAEGICIREPLKGPLGPRHNLWLYESTGFVFLKQNGRYISRAGDLLFTYLLLFFTPSSPIFYVCAITA